MPLAGLRKQRTASHRAASREARRAEKPAPLTLSLLSFFLRPPGARTFRVSSKKIICELLGPLGIPPPMVPELGRAAVPEQSEGKFFGVAKIVL